MLTLDEPLVLVRDEVSADGTFGNIQIPRSLDPRTGLGTFGSTVLQTVEDDWLWNARNRSCIPAGQYGLVRTIYHRHHIETFEVVGVPRRSRILIHVANTEEDVDGCIGLGLTRGWLMVRDEDNPAHPLARKRAALDSAVAFRRFMALLSGVERATLEVVWGPLVPNPEHGGPVV